MKMWIKVVDLKKSLSSPVFRNFVISEDGKTSGIIVNIKENDILKIIFIKRKKKLKDSKIKLKNKIIKILLKLEI